VQQKVLMLSTEKTEASIFKIRKKANVIRSGGEKLKAEIT
jgi:hypothetical protein